MTGSPEPQAPQGAQPTGRQPSPVHPSGHSPMPAGEVQSPPPQPATATPGPVPPATTPPADPLRTRWPLPTETPPPTGAPPHSHDPQPPATVPSGRGPKEIATLPPLPQLRNESPPSRRTGEPVRPALALLALVVFQLAAAGVAFTYGWHWWRAAHPRSYSMSARLIEWVDPEPGKWLALTLEGVLAAVAALVASACGVAGFQAWNGWRWSRWAGVVALGLTGVLTTLFTWWGLIPVGLALLGAVLLFLPPMTRFYRHFDVFRTTGRLPYRRPERIFYGRLPRYR